jgi:type IV pili sensor histidine kinase/response regulator
VSFDLVISDIEMPRVDGLELLKEIRSSPVWHNLPVVMLTSRENQWHRQTASSLGATDYLSKPFRHEQLLSTIATVLT